LRYQSSVTDTVHSPTLTELSAAETRLAGVLARPKWVALGCVAALTACGWLALGLLAAKAGGFAALCRPLHGGGVGEFALALPIWAAMTLAMMLPTAGPMILTYAEIADTAARKRETVVSPLVLAAGYVAVWLGFAVAAATLQVVLPGEYLAAGPIGILVSGALFVLAGLYQFSPLKHSCLTLCQRPFPFFFAHWTTKTAGVFRLGLRQGLYCLGCCAAMMLLMFATGAMNVIWMAMLGIVMTIEKLATTTRFTHVVGVGLVAIGLGFVGSGLLS
jgi:predicted metal-binding membrane protein